MDDSGIGHGVSEKTFKLYTRRCEYKHNTIILQILCYRRVNKNYKNFFEETVLNHSDESLL